MSDVIDFNEVKNKVTDKDIQKFENYVSDIFYQMIDGKLSVMDMTGKIKIYMSENNISEEKFNNIQDKLLKKYSEQFGIDFDNIEEQMKSFGLDIEGLNDLGVGFNYEEMRKNMSFHDKYKSRMTLSQVSTYFIKNDINDIHIILKGEEVIIRSDKEVNLNDEELNEFLCSYKKVMNNENLSIVVCNESKMYRY